MVMDSLNPLTMPQGIALHWVSLYFFVPMLCLHLVQLSLPLSVVRARWLLTGQALLALAFLHASATMECSVGGCLVGSVLLVMARPVSWVALASVVALLGVEAAVAGLAPSAVLYLTLTGLMSGLGSFGLSLLADLSEGRMATEAAVEVAIRHERQRFRRDLHDLIGLGLSSIRLKCHLAYRLAGKQDDRVRAELQSVLSVSEAMLADVRSVASGYRHLSFSDTLDAARDALAAIGVKLSVDMDVRLLRPAVGTVLAAVVREGVTNVITHSEARQCRLTVSQFGGEVRLELANDGVRLARRTSAGRHGTGLGSLHDRVARIGGILTAMADYKGWFHVVVRCPARPAALPVTVATPTRARSGLRPTGFVH
jgi:two-component system sensor histidine kinase DesK